MLLPRTGSVRNASGRRVEEVPGVLPDARRSTEDRTTDGGVQPALLPLQPGRGVQATLGGHRFCTGLRDNHAEHRPAHAEPEARA